MILTELFIILALILANGVFAGAEIAIVSLRLMAAAGGAEPARAEDPTSCPEATLGVGIPS